MSFTSPQDEDLKDRIRQATDIVDLVGGYLPLRRQGRIFVGLCPWHDDSKPSLQVNPERQSWKCWVCDLGGDAFSFVMKREGIGFREALQLLADRAGIPLPTRGQPKTEPGSPHDKRTLYRAVQWAEQQFHRCLLQDSQAEPARRYLNERGIHRESIEKFHLGYAPDQWQWLVESAPAAAISPAVLEAAGLIGFSSKSGRPYDRFRGRLMFSIRDVQARPIAFGGRVLPGMSDAEAAKYINSPETRLFSKSDQLYGLDVARDTVAKKREIVVVEGYTDTIMAHQVGVGHVVAVLGTALGPRHIKLLRRFADRITLVLDGDEAGQRRTNEILGLFIAEQVDLRVLTLPEGLDPCDFLLREGAEAFTQLLGGAVDALEHKVRVATRGIDPVADTHRANQALEDILATMAAAPRQRLSDLTSDMRLREQQMLARLARQFGVRESELRTRWSELQQRAAAKRAEPARQAGTPSSQPSPPPPRVKDMDPRELELLEILTLHPEHADEVLQSIAVVDLPSPAARAVLQTIQQIRAAGRQVDFGNVLTALDDPHLKNVWVEIDERAQAKAPDAQEDAAARLGRLIQDFRYAREAKDRLKKLAALEGKHLNDEEELLALQSLIAQERNRRGISAPTDG